MLELIDVSVIYDPKTKFQREALNNVNLKISLDEAVTVVGRIGSGKSTLIQLFNGLLKPSSGRVLLNGADLSDRKISKKDVIRKIGLVFQYPEDQIFSETVYDEVAFGPRNIGFTEEEVLSLFKEALSSVGLDFEELKSRNPLNLSGGEKRRVAIASIIAMQPELLVLDEPTAGMDFEGRRLIIGSIKKRIQAKKGVVFITHSMEEAISIGGRLVVLDRGYVVYDGKPEDFFLNEDKVKETGLDIPFGVQAMEGIKKCYPDVPVFRDTYEIANFIIRKKGLE